MREPGTGGRAVLWGVLAGLVFAGPVCAQPMPALAPGDQAPVLSGVTYPVRKIVSVDWTENKLTLVNFFATWCQPCKVEMPLLEEAYLRHAESGFDVIGVFERQEVDEINDYIAEVQVTYTIMRPDAIVDHYWGGIAIKPTSFLVDSRGRIVRKYVGAMPEQTEGLVADIEAYMSDEPMPAQVVPMTPALPAEIREQLEQDKLREQQKKP